MSKKSNNCVLSSGEDDDFSSSEESLEDDETVEVNGFQVLVSQENQVREMVKKHSDLTSNFILKNQQLKDAYMNVVLDQLSELSLNDLDKADNTLFDQKLDESYLKKEKYRVSETRTIELEEQVKKRKLTLSDLESDLKNEKATALAAKAGVGFRDVV